MVFLPNLCYDNHGDSMEIEIELIPISEIKKEENTFLIPLSKVEHFAHLATTLTPLDAFREIDGYTSALWEYMQDHKYQDKESFTSYDKLIHANMGNSFLTSLIQLLLIEKDMRNNGISQEIFNRYQILLGEYQSILEQLKKK